MLLNWSRGRCGDPVCAELKVELSSSYGRSAYLSPSMADSWAVDTQYFRCSAEVDDIEDVIRDFARRDKAIKRVVMTPSAFDPEAHPESVLMRARRLGLIVSRLPSLGSGDAPPI